MNSRDPFAGLSIFLALSENLSFSRTAAQLGLSKTTVTTQTRALEDRLGVRLLQRNTRSVTLTEAGLAYKQSLAGVLMQTRAAEREAKSYQDENIGTIRLSVSPDLGQQYLSSIVANFIQENPGIRVVMDLSLESVDLVEGGFDLAIRGTMELSDSLIIRKLASCTLVPCASPGYIARSPAIVRPEDLTDHSCLHFQPLRWGRSWLFRKDGTETVVTLTPSFETNDSISLREAARAGAGVTLLPKYVIDPDIKRGLLEPVLQDWTSAEVPIHAVYPANRHIAAKVKHFVTALAKALAVAFESSEQR